MLPTCQMNETKLEVNENYEETELSDVDDDLFVRTGGRNGFRLEFNDIAKKPLMTPRRRKVTFISKSNLSKPYFRKVLFLFEKRFHLSVETKFFDFNFNKIVATNLEHAIYL